jgi:uncharacterized protein
MPFMAYCLDKPGALETRMAARPKHVEYLASHSDKLMFAGPLLDEKDGMIGSLLVVDVADRAAMDTFLKNDPYAQAGLFHAVTVHPVRKAYPK